MRPIVFSDLNPDLKTHYTYQCWIAKKNPARNVPLRDPDDWVSLQMNLAEDADHVSASYREGLMDGSDADIQRFVSGYWRDEREHSLFRPSVVNRFRVQAPPADLRRIVVAVDPAISSHEGSDETGIVVAAEAGDGDYYVLADYSLKGAPKEWAAAAVQAYHDWEADRIVAEQNQGGLMVSETLRHASRNVPVKLVHASRGKVIRAEPISALYADGRVHHVGEFKELERQMFAFHSSYDRRKEGSPDRLDALVWAVTELAVAPAPSRHVASGKVAGRYG
jgi:phage terminase large subunit-like protein